MNQAQYELKKRHLANKIKAYYAKLEQKKAAADGIFKAKEQARIGREHGRWDRKAAKFAAKAARWNMEWERRKAEWEHRKDW